MKTQERNHHGVLDRTLARAGQHIHETADQLGETATRASDRLEESFDDIRTKFNDVRDSVTGKTRTYAGTLNSYVGKNPWVAIGISAGFAFLAGMLIGRRRDD